jgi:hypothetical protein
LHDSCVVKARGEEPSVATTAEKAADAQASRFERVAPFGEELLLKPVVVIDVV